jgi:hypothetical protein
VTTSRITDDAREAGLAALHNDEEWHKPGASGVWRANYKRAVDLVLEAAEPHMAPEVDREALEQVIAEAIDDLDGVEPSGFPADWLDRRTEHVTDAVLTLLNGSRE